MRRGTPISESSWSLPDQFMAGFVIAVAVIFIGFVLGRWTYLTFLAEHAR